MGAGYGITYGLFALGRRYPRLAFSLGLLFGLAFLAAGVILLVTSFGAKDIQRVFAAVISAVVGAVLIVQVWPLHRRIRRKRQLD